MNDNIPIITILGAGLSGLSVAYHYKGKSVIYEKSDSVGGVASTKEDGGFLYDYGPHALFTKDPYVIELLTRRTSVIEKIAKPMNAFRGIEFPHPALFNLSKLPSPERYKILKDYIESYKNFDSTKKTKNYAEWLVNAQGKYFAASYTAVYTRKFWQTDPENLTIEWVGQRIPAPSINDVLKGAFGLNENRGYYFNKFKYPKRGGFGSFSNFWQDRAKDITINLGKEVILIDVENKILRFRDGTSASYDVLVSTIPLPELPKVLSTMPHEIKSMISKLKYTSLHYVNLAMKEKWKKDFTWLYFYDADVPISRLIPYNNMSSNMAPLGCSSVQVEIPYSGKFSKELEDISLSKLKELNYIRESNILKISEFDLKYGYVIYNKEREKYLKEILEYLKSLGIYSLGRYGSWGYLWSYQVVIQGKEFAKKIMKDTIINQKRG